MLDVCLLGTGGMMPLPNRWLTALMLRYNGSNMLIDCGEGTQITMKLKGWSFKAIDFICFTHYHGDHISGLPGLLLTIGNSDRREPITLIGPKGIERVVNGLRVIAPELPYEIKFIELTQAYQEIVIEDYHIEAFQVDHKVTCFGYSINILRKGKFSAERAKEQNIPLKLWSKLQKGEVQEFEGATFTPDMVLGEPRKGIKVTYCTDSRPVKTIENHAYESDLFICEGMYGEPVQETNAREYKHMTFQEAATLALNANVRELWLTHFSPALVHPKEFESVATAIFQNTKIGKDRMSTTFIFEDEEE